MPKTTFRLPQSEFVALLAMLFAIVAFSIDAMLPALPQISAELSSDAPNKAQLVLTAFVLGLGVGTFVIGPISDAYGRKRVILTGFVLYMIGAWVAVMSQSLELLLAARVLQGIGASAPRIAGLAMIRDLYEGRAMARITSFVMMIFLIFPAVAPQIGALIIPAFGWRGIFGAFILFALVAFSWMAVRQPETLTEEDKRPFRLAPILRGIREVGSNRLVMAYLIVMSLTFGQLFATISSIQSIYEITFGLAESFPRWFALTAVLSVSGTVLNARLVMRLGMRRLVIAAYKGLIVVSVPAIALIWMDVLSGHWVFAVFFIWNLAMFWSNGLTFGNLNALALQPMGHMAGLATSFIGGVSTVLAVLIAVPIGLAFNGTPIPLMLGSLACTTICLLIMRRTVDDA